MTNHNIHFLTIILVLLFEFTIKICNSFDIRSYTHTRLWFNASSFVLFYNVFCQLLSIICLGQDIIQVGPLLFPQTNIMTNFTSHRQAARVLINKISIDVADTWETTQNLQACFFFLTSKYLKSSVKLCRTCTTSWNQIWMWNLHLFYCNRHFNPLSGEDYEGLYKHVNEGDVCVFCRVSQLPSQDHSAAWFCQSCVWVPCVVWVVCMCVPVFVSVAQRKGRK